MARVHSYFDGLSRFAGPWLLVLTSLSDGPEHGYAIMTDAAAFSGVRMEPGTLYRALSRLERRGWVRPLAAAGRRRPYKITATWPCRASQGGAAGRARRPRPAAGGRCGSQAPPSDPRELSALIDVEERLGATGPYRQLGQLAHPDPAQDTARHGRRLTTVPDLPGPAARAAAWPGGRGQPDLAARRVDDVGCLPQRAGYPLPRTHLPRLLRQIGEQLAQRRQVSHPGLAPSARHSPGPGALGGAACLVGEVAGHHAAQPRSPGHADVLADVRADRHIRAGARLRILRHRNHPLPSARPA